jgi:hypothetical protein
MMDSARWNELIEHAAATAVEEAGDAPTIPAVALKAAKLGTGNCIHDKTH